MDGRDFAVLLLFAVSMAQAFVALKLYSFASKEKCVEAVIKNEFSTHNQAATVLVVVAILTASLYGFSRLAAPGAAVNGI